MLRFGGKALKPLVAILAAAMLWGGAPAATAPATQPQRPKYPEDLNKGRGKKRGFDAKAKLSPELAILFDQFVATRGGQRRFGFDDEQVRELFNISGVGVGSSNPYVGVSVRVEDAADLGDLKSHGARIYLREGDLVLADIPVRSLERLAGENSVQSVSATKAAQAPPAPSREGWPSFAQFGERQPQRAAAPSVTTSAAPPSVRGLTGKGVIVGIVDTGIDWRHEDFINPDGTSRILYLWDMTDDSFESSGGRIGTRPPVVQDGGVSGPGTIYTGRQITDALRGTGAVNSTDDFGHGTAAAGTAAGNGRATANGVPAGSYAGVAPEADLIIVKAGACGSFDDSYLLGTYWSLGASMHFEKQRGRRLSRAG